MGDGKANKKDGQFGEAMTKVFVWLMLGVFVGFLPVLVAFLSGKPAKHAFEKALSGGDLLIATTAMLAPALADLAINGRRARRGRIIIVSVGAVVAMVALLLYGLVRIRALAPNTLPQLTEGRESTLSLAFYVATAIIGAICTVILASGGEGSDTGEGEANGPPNSAEGSAATGVAMLDSAVEDQLCPLRAENSKRDKGSIIWSVPA